MDADDAMVVVFDEAGYLVLHEEVEGGELCCLGGEEVEEVPLGHERYEFGVGREVREVGHGDDAVADVSGELGDLRVRNSKKFVEQTQLVKEFQRRRMDRIATKIAQEIRVFFEDRDGYPAACEKEAEHHACRASANDAARGRELISGCAHGGMRLASAG